MLFCFSAAGKNNRWGLISSVWTCVCVLWRCRARYLNSRRDSILSGALPILSREEHRRDIVRTCNGAFLRLACGWETPIEQTSVRPRGWQRSIFSNTLLLSKPNNLRLTQSPATALSPLKQVCPKRKMIVICETMAIWSRVQTRYGFQSNACQYNDIIQSMSRAENII